MATEAERGRRTSLMALAIIIVIALIVAGAILLMRDKNNQEESLNTPTPKINAPSASESVPSIQSDPNNPNGTTGGIGTSNTQQSPTPSPAGGVDTNGIQAEGQSTQ